MSAEPLSTTKPNMTVVYGFGDDFDAELEEASKFQPKDFGPRPVFKATPGAKTAFAKAGQFVQKFPNPRDPKKELTRTTSALEGLLVDASFNREYWIKDEEGKNKLLCQTVSHRTAKDQAARKAAEEAGEEIPDLRSGNGKPQIPYGGMLFIEKYEPMGSRGKSCADCIGCGDHGKPAGELKGESGCRFNGSVILLQTAFDGGMDEEGNPKGMVEHKVPILANLQTPQTSGIEMNKYMQKLKKDGQRLTDVVTRLEVKPAGSTNIATFTRLQTSDPKVLKAGMELYQGEIARIETEREEFLATKKAERDAKGNKGSKPAAPSTDEEAYDL